MAAQVDDEAGLAINPPSLVAISGTASGAPVLSLLAALGPFDGARDMKWPGQ